MSDTPGAPRATEEPAIRCYACNRGMRWCSQRLNWWCDRCQRAAGSGWGGVA